MNYRLNFSNPNQKVHFIGIGGISMSALAEILVKSGFSVSGSDLKLSNLTQKLSNMGVTIYEGHEKSHIVDPDVVVYTAAVKQDNPEYIAAKEKNIPMMDRAELLGFIMKNYQYSIAVAGTHGKTTTTSMMSHILLAAHVNPTIHVGGELDAIGGNVYVGGNQYFVTEACEYANSFLKFAPYIGIILNIEADHLDYFKDLDHILSSFLAFTQKIHPEGYAVINADQGHIEYFKGKLPCNVITYGKDSDKADYSAANITYNEKGLGSFEVLFKGQSMGSISLSVPGEHNVYNALSAIASATALGIDFKDIQQGLKNFGGTHRRFEYKGTTKGITIIDDYAHHPTEIIATLKAAKNYPHRKLWCVFQPHTYSRTKTLLKEFSTAFDEADGVIITDIYAAREKDPGDIHAKDLVKAVKPHNPQVHYISDLHSIPEFIFQHLNDGDLLITMGAGTVYTVGENMLK